MSSLSTSRSPPEMSSVQEYLAQKGPILLEAFGHQVGGHTLLFKLSDDILCKPLLSREFFFYETIPAEIRTFIPQYHGVISVCFEKQENGEIKPLAYPKKGLIIKTAPPPLVPNSHDLRLSLKCTQNVHQEPNVGISFKMGEGNGYLNPWSAQCSTNTKKRLEDMGDQVNMMNQDYVVLEDLTSKFRCPSILDLKVGTRQYGDDVSEQKKRNHLERCAQSTTSTLGVRLCGMQLYDAAKEEYVFHDKYYGRALTKEGFYKTLREFLHNGISTRTDLLPQLVKTLTELRDMISKQDTYRFFSSSLLIIYDGKTTDHCVASRHDCSGPAGKSHLVNGEFNIHETRKTVDVRMIDFAHVTHSGYSDDLVQYSGPDDGYIVGLNTVISAFEGMMKEV